MRKDSENDSSHDSSFKSFSSTNYGESEGISTIAGASIAVNYIIGTGVFSLPYAVYSSGIVFGIVSITLSGIFSLIGLLIFLEAMSRTQAVYKENERNDKSLLINPSEDEAEKAYFQNSQLITTIPNYSISSSVFSYSHLCKLMGGKPGFIFSEIIIILYNYGTLWSCTAVFGSSVVTIFYEIFTGYECDIYNHPSTACHLSYYFVVLIYGAVVISLALLNFKEQAFIQQTLTVYRFSAFILMIGTIAYAMSINPSYDYSADHSSAPYVIVNSYWNWSGYTILTSSSVAFTVHGNFPDIVAALEDRSKKSISLISTLAIASSFICYISVGIICALYFGKYTEPLVTLNWKNYVGYWTSDQDVEIPWWAYCIRIYIMMFPVLDMLSVFPLVATTLATNLELVVSEVVSGENYTKAAVLKICKVIASVPPIMLGLYTGNLDDIFSWTGLLALFIQFFIPCSLLYASYFECVRLWGKEGSKLCPYSITPKSWNFPQLNTFAWTFALIYAVLIFILSSVSKFITPVQ